MRSSLWPRVGPELGRVLPGGHRSRRAHRPPVRRVRSPLAWPRWTDAGRRRVPCSPRPRARGPCRFDARLRRGRGRRRRRGRPSRRRARRDQALPPDHVTRRRRPRARGPRPGGRRSRGRAAGCRLRGGMRLPRLRAAGRAGTSPALLRMRGSLDAGEAVTVLAPIASALARMHAAGVAHGAITASSILFTADGSPTLIGFGRAELFGPGSPEVVLESVPAVAADREALRTLAVSLLERVSASASDAHEPRRRRRRGASPPGGRAAEHSALRPRGAGSGAIRARRRDGLDPRPSGHRADRRARRQQRTGLLARLDAAGAPPGSGCRAPVPPRARRPLARPHAPFRRTSDRVRRRCRACSRSPSRRPSPAAPSPHRRPRRRPARRSPSSADRRRRAGSDAGALRRRSGRGGRASCSPPARTACGPRRCSASTGWCRRDRRPRPPIAPPWASSRAGESRRRRSPRRGSSWSSGWAIPRSCRSVTRRARKRNRPRSF